MNKDHLADPTEIGSTSDYQRRQRLMNRVLPMLGLVLGAVVFLTLDWFRTATIRRSATASGTSGNCRVHDPVRHHAFKPNCTFLDHWGRDSYEFSTNSLGFRDDRIREIPLADARPRVLMLGDSMTEGKLAWRDSYVGRISAHFPQYDFLNGGTSSYSPSNYLNVTRMVLAAGVEFDEVMVFIDINDVQDEAAFYQNIGASGAVTGPARERLIAHSWYAKWRLRVASHLTLTGSIFEFFDRLLVRHGYYHSPGGYFGDPFDVECDAWSYRKVNETDPYPAGYAPLEVEGGIAKEKARMTLLWQELRKRNIPISVVVYPHPSQVVHDTADSRQVRIWRGWCEGKCKRFISLFPAVLAVKDQCPQNAPGCWYPSLFVFGDVHYNAGGNALVADTVIKSLTEEPPTKRQPEVSDRDSARDGGN